MATPLTQSSHAPLSLFLTKLQNDILTSKSKIAAETEQFRKSWLTNRVIYKQVYEIQRAAARVRDSFDAFYKDENNSQGCGDHVADLMWSKGVWEGDLGLRDTS